MKVKDSQLAAVSQRLKVRRSRQKAILAVAHRLLVAISHMLTDRVPYREIGTAPLSDQAKRKQAERMERQIEKLGYTVTLQPVAVPVS